jgi:hypothetical protein
MVSSTIDELSIVVPTAEPIDELPRETGACRGASAREVARD